MKLHIENIMAIGSADIDLDGITVIVGNNNTGKSTTGKVLWAMFSVLSGLAEKAHDERVKSCKNELIAWMLHYDNGVSIPIFDLFNLSKEFACQLVDGILTIEAMFAKLQTMLQPKKNLDNSAWNNYDKEIIAKKIQSIIDIDEKELLRQVVLTEFERIFKKQFVPLFSQHDAPFVEMVIKGKKLSVNFAQTPPALDVQLQLHNKPYYFDNPDLLDKLGEEVDVFYSDQMTKIADAFSHEANAVDEILLRKKFEEIEKQLANILGGQVEYDKDKKNFCFTSPNYTVPLNLSNLSQGVKAMAMLQAAFSNGAIEEGDVLILDEPEIHLHPEWQVKYAELIVLLQKAFHLTVLLTSHSPDFVAAIQLYSQKYGLDGKLNGYISERLENGTVTMKKVPDEKNWDEMFVEFAGSVDTLLALRDEVEN